MNYNPGEKICCIICGSTDYQILLTHHSDPLVQKLGPNQHQIRMLICKNCGLVFQNPQPDSKTLADIYSYAFRAKSPSEKYFRIIYPDAKEKIQWLKNYLPSTKRCKVLDIGSAAGILLNMFKKNQWDTFGIEPSLSFAEYSRSKYELKVKTGLFQEAIFPGINFDLVVISHVLEHISDPINFLKAVAKKIKEDGYLFVEVPDIRRPKIKVLYSSFFAATHLFLFSPNTLAMVLAKAGFRIIAQSNAKRGFRVLAKKIKPQEKLHLIYEKDDYKKITRNISLCRAQYLATVASKKMVSRFGRGLVFKILGIRRAQHFITALKK